MCGNVIMAFTEVYSCDKCAVDKGAASLHVYHEAVWEPELWNAKRGFASVLEERVKK